MRWSVTVGAWSRWDTLLASAAALAAALALFSDPLLDPWIKTVGVVAAAVFAFALVVVRLGRARVEAKRERAHSVRLLRIPITPVEEVDPTTIGVDRAAQTVLAGGERPVYLPRERDAALRSEIAQAFRDFERWLVVVHGPSKVGKSRALFEAVRTAGAGARMVAPVDGAALKALLVPGQTPRWGSRPLVLWLDDLEPFLNQGMAWQTLREWHAAGRTRRTQARIVVATYGGKGIDRIAGAAATGLATTAGDVLQHARLIPLTATTPAEEAALSAAGVQSRRPVGAADREAVRRHGLAAFLVAGPALELKLTTGIHAIGETACGAGVAVVEAAVDWARCGRTDPIPDIVLRRVWPAYLPPDVPPTDPEFASGLSWAQRPVAGSIALITRTNGGTTPYDYVVRLRREDATRPIPHDPVWEAAVTTADPVQAAAVGDAAYLAGRAKDATTAFSRARDTTDSAAAARAGFNYSIARGERGDTFTLFLAPDGSADGVLKTLVDLSAAGLVDPFLWVTDSSIPSSPKAHEVSAVSVRDGRTQWTTVQGTLVDEAYARVRLCVVVPLSGGSAAVTAEDEQYLAQLLRFNSVAAPVTLVRALVGRPGDRTTSTQLCRNGWHNILVAPEEARGPGKPLFLLTPSADIVEIGRDAAPVIAGIIGLWSGIDRIPFDDNLAPDGVRVGRAFYCRIDADQVEQELRRRVLSTVLLPRPSNQVVQALYFADIAAACRTMADRWWRAHRSSLVGPRRQPIPPAPVEFGRSALSRLFFTSFWARLSNVPHDVVRSMTGRVASRNARALHDVGVDAGEACAVIVGGLDGTGSLTGWRDLVAAARALGTHFDDATGRHTPMPDLHQMWDDFACGAMTLVDAGHHGPFQAISVGPHPGVARSTAEVVPPPGDAFTEVPGQLRSEVGDHVPAGDMLGADTLSRRLEQAAQDQVDAATTARSLHALAAWRTAHRYTYSAQVAQSLAGALLGTVAEIRHYLLELRDLAEEESAPSAPSRSRSDVWLSRLLGMLAVAGLVSAPFLTIRGITTGRQAIVLAAAPLLLLLAASITSFVRDQRWTFRELHRRQQRVSRLEVLPTNLQRAIYDVRRLGEAYEQYLMWNAVVGAVLQNPFGPPCPAEAARARPTCRLPRTTRVAHARIDDWIMLDAVSVLRRDLFSTSWLDTLWHEHLHEARAQTRHPHSWPRRWADQLSRSGPAPGPGERAWTVILASLRCERRALAVDLLSSLQETGTHVGHTQSLDDFLAGVDKQPRAATGDRFADDHFTAEALTRDVDRVSVHLSMQAWVGLSRVDVCVQLSDALPPWEFALAGARFDLPRPGA